MKRLRISTFADQDSDRRTLTRIARRAVADMTLRMDLVTSPGGLDDGLLGRPSPETETAEYKAFRDWWGGFMLGEILAFAGDLLSRCEIDEHGRVSVAARPPPRDPQGAAQHLAARLVWLITEIPSLQSVYRQLYPDEVKGVEELCARVDALDLQNPADLRTAEAAWPELESWYMLAQPGARILRRDKEAMAAARVWLDRLAAEVDAERADQISAERALESGTAERTPENVAELDRMIEAAVDRAARLAEAAQECESRLARLRAARIRLA